MDGKNTMSAMSASLLARNVYCVCFPERDGIDSLQGELAQTRKKYFTGGRRAVRVGKSEVLKGLDGKMQGKLSRRNFYWKKTTGKASGRISLEEAFDQKNGHVLVKRDYRNIIVSRTFFDRDHRWIRSEYYEPWDTLNAKVSFKPSDASDMVERFDRDGQNARSTELYPLPYLTGTPEQSILNARFGEPGLIVSTAEGDMCYCPRHEAELRRSALEEIRGGSIMLMPAWEVRDGSLAGEEGEEETNVTFTSLEEYARIQPSQEQDKDEPEEEAVVPLAAAAEAEHAEEEFFAVPDQEMVEEAEEAATEEVFAIPDQEMVEEAEETAAPEAAEEPAEEIAEETAAPEAIEEATEEATKKTASPDSEKTEGESETAKILGPLGYRGDIRDGKITGRGRTEQQNGLTAYDGEYADGKREGFGSYYYKDGNLCYAGFWKDDRKDGLGVSFRDTDHALHIAKWENGQPGGFVSLFDKDGNLRYGGRIENGLKQGAGVSFNQEDGTVFVGKWEDGKATGLGSAFDRDGNLLYYGGWKDGKRSGHGTEFDKNGGIIFDGEWKDGKYHNGILYQKLTQEPLDEETGPDWDNM